MKHADSLLGVRAAFLRIVIQRTFRLVPGWVVLGLFLIPSQFWAFSSEKTKSFAFVNPNYIIAAEPAGKNTFVVNFINLSDYVLVVEPEDFLYRSVTKNRYIGQVYELDHPDQMGGMQRYSASILLKDHSFVGLNIVGKFREQDRIEEMSVRIGARRFYLQPLEKARFEELIRKIEKLDLDSSNIEEMYREANITEIGLIESADGTSEWDRDWEGLLTLEGENPPKVIENPPVLLPEGTRLPKNNGKVRVSCQITKNGGVRKLKVVKGVDRKLDQRALDWVANSWVFLPLTKNGEVYESVFKFNVGFISAEETSGPTP